MSIAVKKLKLLYETLLICETAIDLFGSVPKDQDEATETLAAKKAELLAICRPEDFRSEGDQVWHIAIEATGMLHAFHDEALAAVKTGEYWDHKKAVIETRSGALITTPLHEYRVYSKLATGSVADVYLADYLEGPVVKKAVIKVSRDAVDNGLLETERKVLDAVGHKSLPRFVEGFTNHDGLAVNVLRYIEGLDLYAIRSNPNFKDGLPVEHVCWILERLLSVTGYLHSNMTIHGNIEPGNIIVRAKDHNAFLVDPTFAISNPKAGDYIHCLTPYYSAPEVSQKFLPLPTADIYSLGMSMIYLLGGDPKTVTIPSSVDRRIADFLRRLTKPDPLERAQDAWELHREFSELRTKVYGKKHFVVLELGGGS